MTGLLRTAVLWDRATFLAIDHTARCRLLDIVMPRLTDLGLGHVQVLAILGAAVVCGVAAGEVRLRGLGRSAWRAITTRRGWVVPLIVAFALSGLATTSLKKVPRERPWWFYELRHARGVDLDVKVATVPGVYPLKVRGFPSGHTCTAAAIAAAATLIFWRERRGKIAIAVLWLLTLLIGWSRMYLASHWPLDVLGGLAIGTAGGLVAVWFCGRVGWRTSGG